jgi:hypothetical protein
MEMSPIRYIAGLLVAMTTFTACEQEFFPPPPPDGDKYVVEGHIEAGERALPAYVILTTTFPFYGELGPDEINDAYVHDAQVTISDGDRTVALTEICLNDLEPELREIVAQILGFDPDSLAVDICAYIDINREMPGRENAAYDLRIVTPDGETITSSTTIPPMVPLDSLRFGPPPGDPSDTLAQLLCYIADPPGVRNYYRYFGSTNGGPYETGFGSVTEDLFFDGKSFEFNIPNPQTTTGDVEPEEFGLYYIGDTVSVKWCIIDGPHYDFWNTLEFSNANQGPFANYTRLQSNVQGALGIWGGYNVRYYDLIVEY